MILDFNTRAQEVDDYVNFMENLVKNTTKLAVFEDSEQYKIQSIDPNLAKMLNANTFLLL